MRSRIAGGRKQLLARALGLKSGTALHVVDATGGMGRDAFTLAALGARVTLIERQAPVCALLRDACRRALEASQAQIRAAAERIDIVETDARVWLSSAARYDAVYLDPMYPEDGKSALPQKEMQLLRELSGGDADADELLQAALRGCGKRVVVKRPLHAAPLAHTPPHAVMRGTQARFDIYLGNG